MFITTFLTCLPIIGTSSFLFGRSTVDSRFFNKEKKTKIKKKKKERKNGKKNLKKLVFDNSMKYKRNYIKKKLHEVLSKTTMMQIQSAHSMGI